MPRNEGDPRLRATRTERRAQQRADNKAGREHRSNAPYIVGATIGAAALIGGAIYIGRSYGDASPIQQGTPTSGIFPDRTNPEMNNPPDSIVIAQEVIRSGIKPSQRETELWSRGHSLSTNKIPVTKESLAIAQNRIVTTLNMMLQSENPHFKKAAELLKQHKIRLELSDDLTSPAGRASMTSVINIHSVTHERELAILISGDHVLNNSNGAILAGNFTHEAKHIEGMLYQLSIPSEEERNATIEFRSNDLQFRIEEEARGYAAESEALLYEIGLGFNLPHNS